MRVDDRNLAGAASTGAGKTSDASRVEHAGQHTSGESRRGAGSDHVELSALSRAVEAGAAARNARIAQLAAQYQAGRYTVDPAKVSRALVHEELQSASSAAK